jgi:hypothetical protein
LNILPQREQGFPFVAVERDGYPLRRGDADQPDPLLLFEIGGDEKLAAAARILSDIFELRLCRRRQQRERGKGVQNRAVPDADRRNGKTGRECRRNVRSACIGRSSRSLAGER